MQQEGNLNNILLKQDLEKQLAVNANNLNSQKVSPIQKRIQQVLTPSNIVFTNNYIDEQLSQQQVRQYSLMNFFSEIYIQMMTQLIALSEKIDEKTGKPIQFKGQAVFEKVLSIINSEIQLIDKISSILAMIKELIVKAIIDHSQRLLRRGNYAISPEVILKVIFNPYCLKLQQSDSITVKLVQNKNILRVLRDCEAEKTAPNVQLISTKLIDKLIKQKFPKNIKPEHFEKWGSVSLSDFVNPRKSLIERYHVQESYIGAYLKRKEQQIDKKLQQAIQMQKS